MDPLLPILAQLARNDDAIQARDDTSRRLKRRLDDLDGPEAAATERHAALVAELDAMRRANVADEAELDHYEHQRKAAVRSLETGLGNPAAAERQLAACRDAIDTLETRILERMDQREARVAEADAAARDLAALREVNVGKRAELSAQLEALRAEQTAAVALRASLAEQLPREERHTYLQLVKTRATALATLRDKACSACGAVPPLQVAANILKGAIGTCTVCGRWLFSPGAAPS
ncbi:MAG TPA: hypothetical protein PKA64_20700 [Myxococcota bacterium]|nr:hypothetical protein [Myxococcota bacterium]